MRACPGNLVIGVTLLFALWLAGVNTFGMVTCIRPDGIADLHHNHHTCVHVSLPCAETVRVKYMPSSYRGHLASLNPHILLTRKYARSVFRPSRSFSTPPGYSLACIASIVLLV